MRECLSECRENLRVRKSEALDGDGAKHLVAEDKCNRASDGERLHFSARTKVSE